MPAFSVKSSTAQVAPSETRRTTSAGASCRLHGVDERRVSLRLQRAIEDVAATCERRAAELITEFPTLGDLEIATLMHDELVNMRSPHRAYYAWVVPANVARVRRTIAIAALRAQRSSGGTDTDV